MSSLSLTDHNGQILSVIRPPDINSDDPLENLFARWLAEADSKQKEKEKLNYGKGKINRPEKKLEYLVGQYLEKQDISVQYQVRCEAGIADIVTPDAVYEIKDILDDNSLFKALGQISIYRQQINPQAKAFIVGQSTPMKAKRKEAIIASAQTLGIEIIFWEQ